MRLYTFGIIALSSALATWISGIDPGSTAMFVLGAGFALVTDAEMEGTWRRK